MRVYKEIIQQTPEWFEIKYGKVGGSSLAHVMTNRDKPIRDNAIYDELLSARYEPYDYEESFTSADMERGNMYEPLARQEFEKLYNVTVEQYGWIEDDDGIFGLSPDGLFDEMKKGIEIKSPNRVTHMRYIRNPISMVEEYLWQVVDYFLTIESLKKLYFLSYRPENIAIPLLVQEVTRRTKVNISKKERLSINDCVKLADARLIELKLSLEEDTAKYKLQTEF